MRYTSLSISIALCLLLAGCNQNPVRPGQTETRAPNKLAELNVKLGIEYMRQARYETALNKFNKALEADPNYATAHNMTAVLYEQIGETDQARQYYQRALSLAPDDSSVLNNFGQFLCRNGDPAKGQEFFASAVANPLYQTPAVAYTNAGTCALENGDQVAAENHFRKALQINPGMPRALLNMAELSYQQQQYLKTRAYLQRYRAVARHTPRTLWLGIKTETELGDKDAAASYKLLLSSQFPESDEAQDIGK